MGLTTFLVFITLVSNLVLSQKVRVRMGVSGNPKWYLSILIENNACNTINKVQIKDNNNYPNWYTHTDKYGNDFKFNNNGKQFKLPISIRIFNSNGEKITKNNLITNWNQGQTFNTNKQFCTGTPTPKPTKRPIAPTPNPPTYSGSSCIPTPNSNPSTNIKWESKNNQLYLNGKKFNMKGLSWFGFETDTFIPHGIPGWSGSLSYISILNWMRDKGFNAIRLPFSWQGISQNPTIPNHQIGGSVNQNAFSGKKLLQAMDIIIDAAGDRGLLIMLDMHSYWINSYTDGFSQLGGNPANKALQVWRVLAQRYKKKWNVFMADLYNEPHDISNGDWNKWINYVNTVSNALIDEGVNWLFAVQGTNANCQGLCGRTTNCNWGENIIKLSNKNGCAGQRPNLKKANRIVYTPHTYGPSFANNLMNSNGWNQRWGFAVAETDAAVILGEFGTKNEWSWFNNLVDYLISINQRNTFFWCFNQNSGDTGGLIKSWNLNDVEQQKLNILNRLQPNPTKITKNSNKICLGSSSNNNAGNDIVYDKYNGDNSINNNDEFWKKATNILLVIIMSLIGIICIVLIAFCLFCRVHSKKMRQRIRQSISRRLTNQSMQPKRQRSYSNSNDDGIKDTNGDTNTDKGSNNNNNSDENITEMVSTPVAPESTQIINSETQK